MDIIDPVLRSVTTSTLLLLDAMILTGAIGKVDCNAKAPLDERQGT